MDQARKDRAKAEIDRYMRLKSFDEAAHQAIAEFSASGQPPNDGVAQVITMYSNNRAELDEIAREAGATSDPQKLELYCDVAATYGGTDFIDGLSRNPLTPRETVIALLTNEEFREMAKTDEKGMELLERLVAHPSLVLGDDLAELAWLKAEVEMIREEQDGR